MSVHNVALSVQEGGMDLFVPIVNGARQHGWASFDRENLPGAADFEIIHVPVRPVDAYDFRSVSFIKMDVEGHESVTLRGALRTIEENRPVVLIKVKEKNRSEVFAAFGALATSPIR